jgi:flagellar protein FliO/FliZ
MDWEIYFRSVLALGVVVALIAGAAWMARKVGFGGMQAMKRRSRRLSIVEILSLDNRRRLVLVRKDETEHLLLIGGGTDVVVEKGWASAGEIEEAPQLEKETER